MSNVYDFRRGRTIKNVNAQSVGEELERIRRDRGSLKPEFVLDEATNEGSPLHSAFEWDDAAAAHSHRINQARRLITSIRILNPPTSKPTVAFVSVKTPDHGRSYVPTIEAMSDDQLRVRVLDELRTFLEALERRYAHFTEAAQLISSLKMKVA